MDAGRRACGIFFSGMNQRDMKDSFGSGPAYKSNEMNRESDIRALAGLIMPTPLQKFCKKSLILQRGFLEKT